MPLNVTLLVKVARLSVLNSNGQMHVKDTRLPSFQDLISKKAKVAASLLKNNTSCLRQQILPGLKTVGPNLSPEQPDISPRRRPSQHQHFEIRRVANLLTAVREFTSWQLLSSLAVLLGGEQINLPLTRARKGSCCPRISAVALAVEYGGIPGGRTSHSPVPKKSPVRMVFQEYEWTNQHWSPKWL